jgi:hypothetical protein
MPSLPGERLGPYEIWSRDGTLFLTRSSDARPLFYLSAADFTSERAVPSERLCPEATGSRHRRLRPRIRR